MTLIAHGILALDKVMADLEERAFPNSNMASRHVERAEERLDRLRKIQRGIAEANMLTKMTIGHPIKTSKENNPLALEGMLAGNVIMAVVGATALATAPIWVPIKKHAEKKAAAAAKAKKEAEEEQERKEAAERAAREEQERKEHAARVAAAQEEAKRQEAAEIDEITLGETLINDAKYVYYRDVDAKKDISALTMGLVDYDMGSIAELRDDTKENQKDYIIFRYGFGNDEIKIFFKNPQTGNYEQIATVRSSLGRTRIIDAIKKRTPLLSRNTVQDNRIAATRIQSRIEKR